MLLYGYHGKNKLDESSISSRVNGRLRCAVLSLENACSLLRILDKAWVCPGDSTLSRKESTNESDMGGRGLINVNNRTWVWCELLTRPLDSESRVGAAVPCSIVSRGWGVRMGDINLYISQVWVFFRLYSATDTLAQCQRVHEA